MNDDPIAGRLAAWAAGLRWDALPAATRAMAGRELLDLMGDMAAGRGLLGMPPWLDAMRACNAGDVPLIGGGHAAPATAALVNGYFAHALELDDTHDEAVLHAGASVIPAALVAARLRSGARVKRGGRPFLEAIVAGIEITCRLGIGTRLNLVEGGWIYSALLGHFGAATAAAKLLSDDPSVLRSALGIAYTMTSGNHQSTREGAETKHLQPAIAAMNGVSAAVMAAAGLKGMRCPFMGEDGLSRVYLHGKLDPARVLHRLGESFEIDRLSFKPYPSCRLTHPAITAALELRRRLGAQVAESARIDLAVGAQAHDVVGREHASRRHPLTRLDAQFSIYWCVALALRDGVLSPKHLVSDIPPGPGLSALMARIACRSEPAASSRDVGACRLTASGDFGEATAAAEQAKGHPDLPLSDAELMEKFALNVALAGLRPDDARELGARILRIEQEPSIDFLPDALTGKVRGSIR